MRADDPLSAAEIRLFLEELCCELCRFLHIDESRPLLEDVQPEDLQIAREVPLGRPAAFADIGVTGPGLLPYFIEVKYGVPKDELLARLADKYGPPGPSAPLPGPLQAAQRLVVVVEDSGQAATSELARRISQVVLPQLAVEVWGPETLLPLVKQHFDVDADRICEETLLDMREAISRKKGYLAFGGSSLAEYRNDALREQLLWRFEYWRLRQLRQTHGLSPRQILAPGLYRGVAIVMADLCSFSSYVRDTPDERVARQCLTAFYSQARYEVVNRGGMLENFVGDEVLALFGVPDRCPGYLESALAAAKALLAVGESVSHSWQRQIDRVQPSAGMHIGVAYGDLQIVPLRPASRTHLCAIADVINVSARLMSAVTAGQIAVTNTFYQQLHPTQRQGFIEMEPQEGRNVGRIKAWRYGSRAG